MAKGRATRHVETPKPTFTSRVRIAVWVTTESVTAIVHDDPTDGTPPAKLWVRCIDRPEGKSEAECVTAGVRAVGSALDAWVPLIDMTDQPLDGLVW